MDRLFLDANVLFTAVHNPHGKAAFLFDMMGPGHWQLVASEYAIEEARRNIRRKYPELTARLDLLAAQLLIAPQVLIASQILAAILPIELPRSDQPIFIAARGAAATHLLTGDLRHFGPYMNQPEKTEGIIIQTVGDYLRGR